MINTIAAALLLQTKPDSLSVDGNQITVQYGSQRTSIAVFGNKYQVWERAGGGSTIMTLKQVVAKLKITIKNVEPAADAEPATETE